MRRQITAAASILYIPLVLALKTIYYGTGFGTYYYDITQVEACGSDFASQNTGAVECSFPTPLWLDQINSEYIVAKNHSQLIEDMSN